ncbi:MAG: hypothetical protein JWP95_507 [Actinotalea sp.]|nr:hypothetical protein [Actinotalea sp.]
MTAPMSSTGERASTATDDLVTDILQQCRRSPGRVALRSGSTAMSYGDLGRRIETTAAGLRAHGLAPGDRVLFSVRPRPEGMVLALGIVAAGGVVVLIDPGSTPELFAARWGAAAPRWAVTESVLYALSRRPLRGVARRRGLLLPEYAALDVHHVYAGRWLPGVPGGALRGRALAADHPPADAALTALRASAPDDDALVVFTSGTTAAPRAVVHTRGSLGAGTRLLRQVCAIAPGEVVHTDQMLLGLPALVAGGTWTLPAASPAQAPDRFAADVGGAAAAFLVPADVTAVLDMVERDAAGGPVAPGPRVVLVGGAPVPAALLERGLRLWPGTRWLGVYGMTEVLPIAVVEAREKIAGAEHARGDLVGRPLEGVVARIDPLAEGQAVTVASGAVVGEDVGELVLAGPSLMRGYLLDGPAAEHRTGDLARWDEQGRLVLVGRSRDMIIRGSTNIYPGLFEPRLARLPGVADALLVGVPRPQDEDEVVVLVVVPRGDPPGTGPAGRPAAGTAVGPVVLRRDDAAARRLGPALADVLDHSALPDHVLFTDAVPLDGRSRKPDRTALRDAAAAWLRSGPAQP